MSKIEEVKKILTYLITESIRHADTSVVFDVESFAHAICRLFEPKPDGIWCPRCGEVFHDEDMTVNPKAYYTCPYCFAIQHTKCRGPVETKPDCDRLLMPEQMAVEMNKLGGEATYKNGLKAIAKAQLAQDFTFEQVRVERLLKEIEKHVSTGHWLEKGFVEWDWWQAIKEREMGKEAENGRKD